MICNDHLEAAGNMVIPFGALGDLDSERFYQFQKLAAVGTSHGSLMIGQLKHPGRQTKIEF
jgi:hypothetical protein